MAQGVNIVISTNYRVNFNGTCMAQVPTLYDFGFLWNLDEARSHSIFELFVAHFGGSKC
jgi:hypothetical protein